MTMRLARTAAILTATVFLVAAAWAQGPQEQALRLYEEAMARYEARDFAGALAIMDRAFALDPSPVYERFRAWCIFRGGDEALGLRRLEALSARSDLAADAARDTARSLARMRAQARHGSLLLKGEPGAWPLGYELFLDGQRLAPGALGVPQRLVVGSHELVVQGPTGRKRTALRIAAGETRELEVMPEGRVRLSGLPEGAAVEVDGAARAGEELELPPGEHILRVAQEGEVLLERRVRVEAGQSMVVLVPPREPAPAPARFSAGALSVGATGLLATGIGIWLLSSAGSDYRILGRPEVASDGRVRNLSQSEAFAAEADLRAGARRKERAGLGLVIGGGLAAGGGLLWWLLTRTHHPSPAAAILLSPRGVDLHGRF